MSSLDREAKRLCCECMQLAVVIVVDPDENPLAMACSLSHLANTMQETEDLGNRTIMSLEDYDALRSL